MYPHEQPEHFLEIINRRTKLEYWYECLGKYFYFLWHFVLYILTISFMYTQLIKDAPESGRDNYYFLQGTQCCKDYMMNVFFGEGFCRNLLYNLKITTLPGLYVLSAIVLGPFGVCSDYHLRFTNLIAAGINFVLYYLVAKDTYDVDFEWRYVVTAINMGILPPLYFFSHVYYTDVFSVTFVMVMLICFNNDMHTATALMGVCAVMMRQTNIVWVAMFGGIFFLRELTYVYKVEMRNQGGDSGFRPNRQVSWANLVDLVRNYRTRWELTKNFRPLVWWHLAWYAIVMVGFLLFAIINGGIVVGDKSAHQATIHVPQIFYFAFFFVIFGWAHISERIGLFYTYVARKYVQVTITLIGFMLLVYLNSLEHPYLLADNRHFTFYIWQRFYQRYDGFRYAMVPLYFCGLFVIARRLTTVGDISFVLFYFPATFGFLCFQRMIEIRYFLLPFLLARMNFRNVSAYALFLELVTYFIMNILTFQVFFAKEVYWTDYDTPQRIMW